MVVILYFNSVYTMLPSPSCGIRARGGPPPVYVYFCTAACTCMKYEPARLIEVVYEYFILELLEVVWIFYFGVVRMLYVHVYYTCYIIIRRFWYLFSLTLLFHVVLLWICLDTSCLRRVRWCTQQGCQCIRRPKKNFPNLNSNRANLPNTKRI